MTVKLTDAQLVVLSAAAQRGDLAVLPLPKSLTLNKAAATRVLNSLIAKGLIVERRAGLKDAVWREEKDSTRLMLSVAEAGLKAIRIVPDVEKPKEKRLEGRKPKIGSPPPKKCRTASAPKSSAKPTASRPASKQAAIIGLLERKDGATIEELSAATGWQAHSVRGAISGTLKKKLGLAVSSEKLDGRGRVYRIASGS